MISARSCNEPEERGEQLSCRTRLRLLALINCNAISHNYTRSWARDNEMSVGATVARFSRAYRPHFAVDSFGVKLY